MELSLNNGKLERLIDPVTDSNCYVIRHGKTCMVIDPGSFRVLEPMLQKWNSCPSLVLLTHEHCDHIGGLNELRGKYETVVVSSSACGEGMQNARENMSRMMETFLYYKSGETRLVPYKPFTCRASDLMFYDQICLQFGGKPLWMKSLPGHTHGSSVIFYDGILFSGDYLLPGDRVITRLPGGSEEEYEKYARPWLSQIPDGTRICPGHGEPFLMSRKVREYHGL